MEHHQLFEVGGVRVSRLEDVRLITGAGTYASDWNLPGQLHAHFVRSDRAHAKIVSIDVSAARAHPGVHAVWSYDDVRHVPPIGIRLTRVGGRSPADRSTRASARGPSPT